MYSSYIKKIQASLNFQLSYPAGNYPKIKDIDKQKINEIIKLLIDFYNHIDTIIVTLQKTNKEMYLELNKLINDKIMGVDSKIDDKNLVSFHLPQYSFDQGKISIINEDMIVKEIRNIIKLMKSALYYNESNSSNNRDEYLYSSKIAFSYLEGDLIHLLHRYDYVMLYPNRIILDRTILEIGLKKYGMNRVIDYLHKCEEYFNSDNKSIEFCSMARITLDECINNICLLVEGSKSDFSGNLTILENKGILKGTIKKQIKEFHGSLSSGGSHPPSEEMDRDEMKLLMDNLYSYLGFLVIRPDYSESRPTHIINQE
jgi:hypothetical protein